MPVTDDTSAEGISADELAAVKLRREQAAVEIDAPQFGLALSGGGIRSATFCLGVLRALAKNGVLHRFDYLSTVSGGGYVGSAFGRLFNGTSLGTPAAVSKGVASDESVFLWWLRNNGRFLAPAGIVDLLRAWASQLRGFVATHIEVAILAALLACATTLPHLVYGLCYGNDQSLPVAISLWWWLLPVPLVFALILGYAYFFLGKATTGSTVSSVIATVTGLILLQASRHAATSLEMILFGIGAVALLSSPLAWISAFVSSRRHDIAANRVRYNAGLMLSLVTLGGMFALGALDMVSWFIKERLVPGPQTSPGGSMATGVGTVIVLLGFARFVLPFLQGLGKGSSSRVPWGLVAHGAGLALLLALALFWTTIFQILVFPATGGGGGISSISSYLRWLFVALIAIVYLCVNRKSIEQLNQSSLHYFYRSRIARAYVSVGNSATTPGAQVRFPMNPLSVNRGVAGLIVKITNLLPGDDVPMGAYAPHLFGGPVHLINCCINQTVDDRTGTFNADRRGINLAVSALGIETGTRWPTGGLPALVGTTLSQWAAVSGAALGSGMGSFTRPGLAALLFLSGLRLGYWQPKLTAPGSGKPAFMPKFMAIWREMTAQFPGLGAPHWYLSDGGHFDNTGVYVLLKRQLPLIVLADCGADPDYRFADVENLIRKARIDYDAVIEFVNPANFAMMAGPSAALFSTPSEMSATPGPEHLLLARITYANGKQGTLLIVKPRSKVELPLDVAGYAERHPVFPQESTTQQFFSEAQWESYCELGMLLGTGVTPALLAALPTWAWTPMPAPVAAMPLVTSGPGPKPSFGIAATVGTSIGIGALLTGLLAGWQAWDTHQREAKQIASDHYKEAVTINHSTSLIGLELLKMDQDGKPFDDAIGMRLRELVVEIGGGDLVDFQSATLRGLIPPLANICKRTTDNAKAGSCQGVQNSLNSLLEPAGPWTSAMAGYIRWRDRDVAIKFTFAVNAALAFINTHTGRSSPPSSSATPSAASSPVPASSVSAAAPRADRFAVQTASVTSEDEATRMHDKLRAADISSYVDSIASSDGAKLWRVRAAPQTQRDDAVRLKNEIKAKVGLDVIVVPESAPLPTSMVDKTLENLKTQVMASCAQPDNVYTLYTQIYSDQDRSDVSQYLTAIRAMGINTPGIENVSASATKAGRSTPFEWRSPTVLYAVDGAACASALVNWANSTISSFKGNPARALPLPAGMGKPNILELWVPRTTTRH